MVYIFLQKSKNLSFLRIVRVLFPIFCRIYAHVYFYINLNKITKNYAYKKNMFGKIYSHLVILNLEQYFIINYYWPIFIPTPNLYLPAA